MARPAQAARPAGRRPPHRFRPPGPRTHPAPLAARQSYSPPGGDCGHWSGPGPAGPWATACPATAGDRPAPFTPFMLGDFVGPVANQFSDVKIAEGESPRPTDRVFIKFNYYDNLSKNRW